MIIEGPLLEDDSEPPALGRIRVPTADRASELDPLEDEARDGNA